MAKRRKNEAAAELGSRGGKARWRGVPGAERSEILRQVVRARWRQKRAQKRS